MEPRVGGLHRHSRYGVREELGLSEDDGKKLKHLHHVTRALGRVSDQDRCDRVVQRGQRVLLPAAVGTQPGKQVTLATAGGDALTEDDGIRVGVAITARTQGSCNENDPVT